MPVIKHPLTDERVEVDLGAIRARLEEAHGIDLSDMKPSSLVMNYSALLRREARDAQ